MWKLGLCKGYCCYDNGKMKECLLSSFNDIHILPPTHVQTHEGYTHTIYIKITLSTVGILVRIC